MTMTSFDTNQKQNNNERFTAGKHDLCQFSSDNVRNKPENMPLLISGRQSLISGL